MPGTTETILIFGGVFVIGLVADLIGRHTPLPRVTVLLISGVVVGPSVVGLLDPLGTTWFEIISQLALTMIGFLLGGHLDRSALREHGKDVVVVSIIIALSSALVVALGVTLVSGDLRLGLLLGGIAAATAPAATVDVTREQSAEGPFTETLLGIVAVDDAWGLLLFGIVVAAAGIVGGGDIGGAVLDAGRELGGGIVLGVALGVPLAYLTGRIRRGDPTQAEAIGAVLLTLGLARYLEVSFLLAAVVVGAVVANLARHHDRPFHAIEGIGWPFMLVFFVLAGAALELGAFGQATFVLVGAYVAFRVVGRLSGGWLGGRMRGWDETRRRWIGPALLPQAGVALGMILIATQRFPDLSDLLLPVVLASTVIFEVFGPVLTRLALRQTGEAGEG